MADKRTLKYVRADHLRQRVVCSLLSSRPVIVSRIRDTDEAPGLRDYEASFLGLIDKMTNGTRTDINDTGTQVHFRPGWISGGIIEHDCGTERSIGYFIEAVLPLCLFAKAPVELHLTGVTNHPSDVSVDLLRAALPPLLQACGVDTAGFAIRTRRRGFQPEGGGLVEFRCPNVRELTPMNLCDEGTLKRVRGTAVTAKVSPQVANRLTQSSRAELSDRLPDVYVYSDHSKGKESGSSPGFSLTLAAETTSGCVLVAEKCCSAGALPEDVGTSAAKRVLKQILRRGCVGSRLQAVVPLLMVLTPEDVSRVRLGKKLSSDCIEMLRHIRDFFGVVFRIAEDAETSTTTLSCFGVGYKNFAKKVT